MAIIGILLQAIGIVILATILLMALTIGAFTLVAAIELAIENTKHKGGKL